MENWNISQSHDVWYQMQPTGQDEWNNLFYQRNAKHQLILADVLVQYDVWNG